jgi:hypothetical protein
MRVLETVASVVGVVGVGKKHIGAPAAERLHARRCAARHGKNLVRDDFPTAKNVSGGGRCWLLK